MTQLKEVTARLTALENGLWESRAKVAREWLEPSEKNRAILTDCAASSHRFEFTDLNGLMLEVDNAKLLDISLTLRDHTVFPIRDSRQTLLRRSFDEALTSLQFYELALRLEYLHLDIDLRNELRLKCMMLLWPRGAREYLEIYDYSSIASLCSRLDLQLDVFAELEPTPTCSAPVAFAGFLQVMTAWYENPNLSAWLSILDDYKKIVGSTEVDKYLAGDVQLSGHKKAAALSAARGCLDFLYSLADIYDIARAVDESSAKSRSSPTLRAFASFHEYWLAKTFGFRRASPRSRYYYDERYDWSTTIQDSPLFRSEVFGVSKVIITALLARARGLRDSIIFSDE